MLAWQKNARVGRSAEEVKGLLESRIVTLARPAFKNLLCFLQDQILNTADVKARIKHQACIEQSNQGLRKCGDRLDSTMLMARFFVAGVLLLHMMLLSTAVAQADEPVLDERIMMLSVEAAKLSALAYENATAYATGVDENGNITLYDHPDYEVISFYTDDELVDQAIVAKTDGRCYLSFRGTTLDIFDWLQNLGLGSVDIFKDGNITSGESCSARGGFADFLLSPLVLQGAMDLQECASTCTDPDDCVILTGHSQGGAIAQLAAILLYSYNPILITFGQPLAVSRECEFLQSERIYRYVNSLLLEVEGEEPYIAYDPVPLFPALGQGRGHYGYYLLLGDDTTALKFLGVDDEDSDFAPGAQLSAVPHTMGGLDIPFSYQARVASLFDNGQFPVNINGFSADTPCDLENSLTCASDDCGLDMVCAAAPNSAPTMAPTTITETESETPAAAPTSAPTKAPTTITETETEPPTSSGFSFMPGVDMVTTAMTIMFGALVPLFL